MVRPVIFTGSSLRKSLDGETFGLVIAEFTPALMGEFQEKRVDPCARHQFHHYVWTKYLFQRKYLEQNEQSQSHKALCFAKFSGR
ncbi:unnamed protein product [Bathycoccus prasinos]